MTDTNKKLAKISKATLEIQERGILNFWIYVDYEDGFSQGVGGLCLDKYDKTLDSRVGTAYGCELIRRLLIELQVNDFSEMKGLHVWVMGDGYGFSFKPQGIKALDTNNKKSKAVMFQKIYDQFITELDEKEKE